MTMINQIQIMFSYDFMRNALYASLLVGVACGLIGTLVVLNRIVFLGGGIAHAAGDDPPGGRHRPPSPGGGIY